MDVRESLAHFVNNGISLRRIADAAGVNKNTITALHKGENVSSNTIEKVKSEWKGIALELYNAAYYEESSNDEEWEE